MDTNSREEKSDQSVPLKAFDRVDPARVYRSFVVFNAEHLGRILAKYATYYNWMRTHVSLGKDAPSTRPIERFGDIVAHPILGGLRHRYAAMIFVCMVGSDEGRR